MTRTIRAARKQLTGESERMAACLCSAIDAAAEAEAYAMRKGRGLQFTSEDIRATALSLYIRRHGQSRPNRSPISSSASRD